MTKEQEAIEILNKFKNNEMQRDKLEISRYGGWKIGDIYKHLELNPAIETVLSMLKEKDGEIQQKNTELAEKNADIEQKEKQIDLMAKAFKQDDVRTVEEIKQYFERKSKEC